MHRAFGEWQAVSSISFSEKEDDGLTDLVVAFERGKHADEFPFDGKGKLHLEMSIENIQTV